MLHDGLKLQPACPAEVIPRVLGASAVLQIPASQRAARGLTPRSARCRGNHNPRTDLPPRWRGPLRWVVDVHGLTLLLPTPPDIPGKPEKRTTSAAKCESPGEIGGTAGGRGKLAARLQTASWPAPAHQRNTPPHRVQAGFANLDGVDGLNITRPPSRLRSSRECPPDRRWQRRPCIHHGLQTLICNHGGRRQSRVGFVH